MAQTEHSLPALADSDADDVVLALQTSHALWRQGDLHEAVRWLRRAAAAAGECGDDLRSFSLAAAAADLTAELNVPRSIVPGVSPTNGHGASPADVAPAAIDANKNSAGPSAEAAPAPAKAATPDDYSETTLVDGGFLRAGQNVVETFGPSSEPPTGVHQAPAAPPASGAALTPSQVVQPSQPPAPPMIAQPPAPPVVAQPPAPPMIAQPPAPPVVAQPPAPPVVAQPPAAPQMAQPPATQPPAPPAVTQPRSASAPAPASAAFSARLAAGIAASPVQAPAPQPPAPPAPPVLAQTAAPAASGAVAASEPPAFGHQALRVVVYASGSDGRSLTARVLAAGETAPPGSQEALLVALHPGERLL